MQGKDRFTATEAKRIRELLRAKIRADRNQQKVIRNKLRKFRFYITDFDTSQTGFSETDFDNLIKSGHIKIQAETAANYDNDNKYVIPAFSTVSEVQEVRQQYKPNKVRVLFVGESPPSGGTFFYFANSNLFRCISLAFNKVYGEKIGDGEKFLQSFTEFQCYLDDLCLQPVNNLTDNERVRMRSEGIDPLAKRIKLLKPDAVIIVMRAIESEVLSAVKHSRLPSVFVKSTTFPAFSESKKIRCLSDTVAIINELIRLKFLPSKLS